MADVKHFEPDEVVRAAELLFWRHGAASTGIKDVLTVTGLSRSSLYNTFGGKDELYVQALRRYLDHRSRPTFARLATDPRGVAAIEDFFTQLVELRCAGDFAGWGCLVSNAHLETPTAATQAVLDEHQAALSAALQAALRKADGKGQLRPGLDLAATAEHLTLLAYAVNLRSRAGEDPERLRLAITAALATLGP